MPRAHVARYGPPDRYERAPPAGFCVSVFALVERQGKVLMGRAAEHARWSGDWMAKRNAAGKAAREEQGASLRLPSAYLREGEHPEQALARILRQQVRAKAWTVQEVHIGSWTHRSDWYPGHKHWDLAITYRVKARVPAQHGPWWAELAWRAPGEVRAKDFGWNDDYAREVGVAR